jgi:hypothetical protein
MNSSAAEVGLSPPAVVTVTSTEPGEPGGDTAVMLESESTLKLCAGTPPKLTAVAPMKSWPAIVTSVPPSVGPDDGDTELTPGCSVTTADTGTLFLNATYVVVVPGDWSPTASPRK